MSMLFTQTNRRRNHLGQPQDQQQQPCPACGNTACCQAQDTPHSTTECPACGVTFKRVVVIRQRPLADPTKKSRKAVVESHAAAFSGPGNEMSHINGARDKKTTVLTCGADQSVTVAPPKTAYDEAEDARFYRRLIILERRRRRKTSAQLPQFHDDEDLQLDGDHPPGTSASRTAQTTRAFSEKQLLDELQDSVDLDTFHQILEMDEDDDLEREFSKAIVEGYIDAAGGFRETFRILMQVNIISGPVLCFTLTPWTHVTATRRSTRK